MQFVTSLSILLLANSKIILLVRCFPLLQIAIHQMVCCSQIYGLTYLAAKSHQSHLWHQQLWSHLIISVCAPCWFLNSQLVCFLMTLHLAAFWGHLQCVRNNWRHILLCEKSGRPPNQAFSESLSIIDKSSPDMNSYAHCLGQTDIVQTFFFPACALRTQPEFYVVFLTPVWCGICEAAVHE